MRGVLEAAGTLFVTLTIFLLPAALSGRAPVVEPERTSRALRKHKRCASISLIISAIGIWKHHTSYPPRQSHGPGLADSPALHAGPVSALNLDSYWVNCVQVSAFGRIRLVETHGGDEK